MRIKLTLQYDGSRFCGWQFQPGLRSVQDVVEQAIFDLTGEKCRVTASGRTDAGVHALGQVAHFDLMKDFGDKLVGALNFYLPQDVRVVAAERVDDNFHARFSAKNKTYMYVMYEAKTENVILRERATAVGGRLNAFAMNRAAEVFVGKHDFAAFMSTGSDTSTTVRTVTSARVSRRDGLIFFFVSADGFLYNMVRKMAAALIEVGKGRMTAEDLAALLDPRATFTRVAPAHGLYLYEVKYDF